jgi:histidine kinase
MTRAGAKAARLLERMVGLVQQRLILKMVIPIAGVVFGSILVWSLYHIEYQERMTWHQLTANAERISETIRLGLDHAMLLNARESIEAIVDDTSELEALQSVRVINKQGEVMFASGEAAAAGGRVSSDSALCQSCHAKTPPALSPSLEQRLYDSAGAPEDMHGAGRFSLVLPIPNKPGCSATAACHDHSHDEEILGLLDLSFGMQAADRGISDFKKHSLYLAVALFLLICAGLTALTHLLINRPIRALVRDAAVFSRGDKPDAAFNSTSRGHVDEMGHLAEAVHSMGNDLIGKNELLAVQMDHYQDLFEGAPCFITVQNRNFELLRYNRAFSERFSAAPGEYCYKAYKNRTTPCPDCPVVKTFETGQPQTTEESGCYKDGSSASWIVRTAPVYNSDGEIEAAMEMCLDITERKELERELKRSEMKYCDIFNNIPSSVFVLDEADLTILDCNRGAQLAYGYDKSELIGMSFLDLFADSRAEHFTEGMEHEFVTFLREGGGSQDQVRHRAKSGRLFYASINASPSTFFDHNVYLVAVTDITTRLEAEQQLIQASKMATLGEMATGVAHEINQPLSVIQTSVDLVRRHLARGQTPDAALLERLTTMAGAQIDRATKIIDHMREFGRKAAPDLEAVDLNDVVFRSFEFFSQQLALRNIEVVWELSDKLPLARCETNRMEQVFINFFINARDAIEERVARAEKRGEDVAGLPRRITIKTLANTEFITVRISDTGVGVPDELAPKIFEPFFTTKRAGKGTGLGLSISYGIVKEYGGAIYVNNNATGGASFHIRLPVANVRR